MECVWEHEKKGKRVLISIEPLRQRLVTRGSVPKLRRERFAAFLGGELTLAWA